MLRWHEVKAMQDAGMEFGSHTCSHPSLPYIPLIEAAEEIERSKKTLEDQIKQPIAHFCYPNPAGRLNYNETLSSLLQQSGFETSVTSRTGYVDMPGNPYEMKRKGIYRIHSRLSAFYWHLEAEAITKWRYDCLIKNSARGYV
jgi:peptidoglycan/xylan/chitin deacetylase (PgdA/CDA1 family)